MSKATENTTVEQVDIDVESLLNPSGSVMVPTGGGAQEPKPNVFSRNAADMSFLNNIGGEEGDDDNPLGDPPPGDPPPGDPPAGEIDDETKILLDNPTITDDDDAKKAAGRPKVDKEGLYELTKKMIESKRLVPFDDDKKLEDYIVKDYEELIEANFKETERKLREQVPAEFYEALPAELQFAVKYLNDGGDDLKGLFRSLAAVEEVRQMDPNEPGDAKQIVRNYLQATNPDWSPQEIEEEITGWEDRNELEAKAQKFQPKLNALTERQVQNKIASQEKLRKQQQEQAQAYMDSVYKTLEPGDLNGIKLDRKTQNLLFSGLVQANYPSVTGKQTNLLGHLLEQHQFVAPNHALVAEALWLLQDPEGYKNKVREVAKRDAIADTVRKLKTEEAGKIATHAVDDERDPERGTKIARAPQKDFFKR
jgi:hypothetical protein